MKPIIENAVASNIADTSSDCKERSQTSNASPLDCSARNKTAAASLSGFCSSIAAKFTKQQGKGCGPGLKKSITKKSSLCTNAATHKEQKSSDNCAILKKSLATTTVVKRKRKQTNTTSSCKRPKSKRAKKSKGRGGKKGKKTGAKSPKKLMRPGPMMRNPFLNYLRALRSKEKASHATEIAIKGGENWRKMTREEKFDFLEQAFYAPKRRRRCKRAKKRTARQCGRRKKKSRKSQKRRSGMKRRKFACKSKTRKPKKSVC